MVPQPITELYAKANAIDNTALTVLMLGILAAVMIAVLAARFITLPIEKFVSTIERIGNGRADAVEDLKGQNFWVEELVTANYNIISMAEKLDHNMKAITRQAIVDELTGLLNRRQFFEEFDQNLLEGEQAGSKTTVGLIDLDGFKPVNDVYGHAAGDLLLKEVSERLRECCGDFASIYRLGGDEFGLLLSNDLDKNKILECGQDICDAISLPYVLNEKPVSISCSVGFACRNGVSENSKEMYERADYALYDAKSSGRDTVVIFEESHYKEMQRSKLIESELRMDGLLSEISLVFQPIIDVHKGKITKFEALARWKNPQLGDVPPSAFITIAEQLGMVNKLTMHLLKLAIDELKKWPDDIQLSFNLSARDISTRSVGLRISSLIAKSGVNPSRIEFEVTETAMMKDVEQCKEIASYLKALGVCFALDDFGTGYSSLSQLHNLPLSAIKIDRCFVDEIADNLSDEKIVKSILLMCEDMGHQCIAEGIETEEQFLKLCRMGCGYMQGYYFAKPMDAAQTLQYIKDQAPALDDMDDTLLQIAGAA